MKGPLSATFCILVWGGTFVGTRELLVDFSALEILVIRFTLAWVALVLMTRKRLIIKHRSDEWLFISMGLTGVVFYQLLENCAIYYTDAVNVAVLTSIGPILTSILVWQFCGERIYGRWFWGGALIAMVGVIVVALDGIVTFHLRPIGDAMALSATGCWGIYTILISNSIRKGYDQLLVIRRAFFWAIVFLTPLALFGTTEFAWLFMDGTLSIAIDKASNFARFTNASNLLCLSFLSLFASAGCFVLWNVACKELGVIKSNIYIYFLPLVSIVTSIIFEKDTLSPAVLLGALCILIGVALTNSNRRLLK